TEGDGQPSFNGLGDDNSGTDDEDGITIGSFTPGQHGAFLGTVSNVTAGSPAFVSAWIDWNGDGDFNDDFEQVLNNLQFNSDGSFGTGFDVPADAVPGPTFARFRISTQVDLGFDGPAPDGEVEDYATNIVACVEPPQGLVAWYRGDGNAYDSAGTNNGATQNGAGFDAGEVGRAFGLNEYHYPAENPVVVHHGTDQFVLVGDPIPAPLQIQNEITLSAWVYASALPGGDGLGLIVGSQYDGTRSGASIFLDARTSFDGVTAPAGHIHFQIGDGDWHAANTQTAIPLGEWVYVVATRKANEDAKIYF